jgi:hypothetical protein
VLVFFQWNSRRSKEFAAEHSPDVAKRAQKEMFENDRARREIEPDEIQPSNDSK